MSTQLNLLAAADNLVEEEKAVLKKYLKYPTKRIRYAIPNYLNFYTLYQYDRNQFREMLREWLKTDEGKHRTFKTLQAKQDEILEKCFIRDENGNKQKDSDECHIYRYKTLHDIMNEIYKIVHWEFIRSDSIFSVDELHINYEDETVEIKGTEWGMSIKDRVIIHIRLLRLLRSGLSIKEGLWQLHTISETIGNTAIKTKNL